MVKSDESKVLKVMLLNVVLENVSCILLAYTLTMNGKGSLR